jgi:hypothetical protein
LLAGSPVNPHGFDIDDHADAMAALEAMSVPAETTNVVRLRRRAEPGSRYSPLP